MRRNPHYGPRALRDLMRVAHRLRIASWNAASFLGTDGLELVGQRRHHREMREACRRMSRADVLALQGVRGTTVEMAQCTHYLLGRHISSSCYSHGCVGCVVFVVSLEFPSLFGRTDLIEVAGGRIAILRCRSASGMALDISNVHASHERMLAPSMSPHESEYRTPPSLYNPLTFANASQKSVAKALNGILEEIAATTVSPLQRGFVRGPQILDTEFDIEPAVECCGYPGLFLFGTEAVFPFCTSGVDLEGTGKGEDCRSNSAMQCRRYITMLRPRSCSTV